MPNFLKDIEEAVGGAKIVSCVIGQYGGFDIEKEHLGIKGKIIPWSAAKPILDYEYDSGYGGAECHHITIWTSDDVFFVGHYDGSTYLTSVPRNPTSHMPALVGGG